MWQNWLLKFWIRRLKTLICYSTELLYKAISVFAADAADFQERAKHVDKKKYGKCIH